MYLPRLFVYHHQSQKGGEAEQFFIQMERRLLKGIINPSLIALWVFGILLVLSNPAWGGQVWLWGKIVLVLAITAVHGIYAKAVRQFGEGERPRTEKYWRIMNEVPFLLLIGIVLLVIFKPFL
ncbi:MAG: CopD family protein, partial [Pseudomonadota bacterium]